MTLCSLALAQVNPKPLMPRFCSSADWDLGSAGRTRTIAKVTFSPHVQLIGVRRHFSCWSTLEHQHSMNPFKQEKRRAGVPHSVSRSSLHVMRERRTTNNGRPQNTEVHARVSLSDAETYLKRTFAAFTFCAHPLLSFLFFLFFSRLDLT